MGKGSGRRPENRDAFERNWPFPGPSDAGGADDSPGEIIVPYDRYQDLLRIEKEYKELRWQMDGLMK